MGFVTLLLAVLTACGGGGGGFSDQPFVIWAGNSNGDLVVDANNHAFAFFDDNGCLFNFQTGRENRFFCLSADDTALYGGFLVGIAIIRSVTGVCIAALIDEATAHRIDIELDAFAREVVFITNLHPDFCL
jgi:hypothetical protein